MPRKARIDAGGALHHIIVRRIERRRIFPDDQDRDNFLERLGDIVTESETFGFAWALMTKHAHILSQLSQQRFSHKFLAFTRSALDIISSDFDCLACLNPIFNKLLRSNLQFSVTLIDHPASHVLDYVKIINLEEH